MPDSTFGGSSTSNVIDSLHKAGLTGFEILIGIVVIGIVISLIILMWKILPRYVHKRSELSILKTKHEIDQIEQENNALIKSYANRFDRIENILDKLAKNDDYREIRLNTLKAIIYSDNAPIAERLECFNEYLKLGGNGNCRKFCAKLILANESLWETILSKDAKYFSDEERKKVYEQSLKDLKNGLW